MPVEQPKAQSMSAYRMSHLFRSKYFNVNKKKHLFRTNLVQVGLDPVRTCINRVLAPKDYSNSLGHLSSLLIIVSPWRAGAFSRDFTKDLVPQGGAFYPGFII